jgi:hypothetical protein
VEARSLRAKRAGSDGFSRLRSRGIQERVGSHAKPTVIRLGRSHQDDSGSNRKGAAGFGSREASGISTFCEGKPQEA